MLGLWAFTNLEMAYAQLRVDERARTYVLASVANVALTMRVHGRARRVRRIRARAGLLLGNFGASALVVLGAVVGAAPPRLAARPDVADLRAMLALRAADGAGRRERLRAAGRRPLLPVPRPTRTAAAGLYAVAIKLATVVFVAVRGFQYAWPPLAYSIENDEEAGRLYSLVTTYYVLATGVVVCGVALLGRWMVRLLAAQPLLRRPPRAAVARARLGALRPVPGLRRDRRPRARDRRATCRPRRRARGQRRAAGPARARAAAPPGHRRRRASRCAAPTRR